MRITTMMFGMMLALTSRIADAREVGDGAFMYRFVDGFNFLMDHWVF